MQAFDPTQFKIDYNEFGSVPPSLLTNWFNNSALVIGNKLLCLFRGPAEQYYWACVVLAHIATLRQTQQVGRTTKATQKDISGEFEVIGNRDDTYWSQTQYGLEILQVFKNRAGATFFVYNPPVGAGAGAFWPNLGGWYTGAI